MQTEQKTLKTEYIKKKNKEIDEFFKKVSIFYDKKYQELKDSGLSFDKCEEYAKEACANMFNEYIAKENQLKN